MVEFKLSTTGRSAQYRRLRRAVREKREQSAVRGILRVQQRVIDGQASELAAAFGREWQPQIATVNAIIDLNGRKIQPARPLGTCEMQVPPHVVLQRRLARLQFPPSHFAIAVAVQSNRELTVADRQLNRPGNRRVHYFE